MLVQTVLKHCIHHSHRERFLFAEKSERERKIYWGKRGRRGAINEKRPTSHNSSIFVTKTTRQNNIFIVWYLDIYKRFTRIRGANVNVHEEKNLNEITRAKNSYTLTYELVRAFLFLFWRSIFAQGARICYTVCTLLCTHSRLFLFPKVPLLYTYTYVYVQSLVEFY